MTTLAGSAQGYKDGIGENAKFHHTSGEEYKEAGIKFCYLFKNANSPLNDSPVKAEYNKEGKKQRVLF